MPISDWSVVYDELAGRITVDLPTSAIDVEQVYNARVRVAAEGGKEHFEPFTVRVTCEGASNTITETSNYPDQKLSNT